MISNLNITIKALYHILIIIALSYLSIAILSYYSVYLDFGKVPSSNDFTQDLIKGTNKKLEIFPEHYGSYIIIGLLYSFIGLPILIILNVFMKLNNNSIVFYKKQVTICTIIYGSILLLANYTEFGGWYYTYVLD